MLNIEQDKQIFNTVCMEEQYVFHGKSKLTNAHFYYNRSTYDEQCS